jgi:hypothetical protein
MILGNVEPMNARIDIDEQDAWRVREGASATATVRGNSEQKVNLTFVRFEPYVLPKKSLTCNSTERTDTRVLQAIFRIQSSRMPLFVGQQIDQVAIASTSKSEPRKQKPQDQSEASQFRTLLTKPLRSFTPREDVIPLLNSTCYQPRQ